MTTQHQQWYNGVVITALRAKQNEPSTWEKRSIMISTDAIENCMMNIDIENNKWQWFRMDSAKTQGANFRPSIVGTGHTNQI